MAMAKKLNNKVRELREKAGLSVYELSVRCNFVSNGRVSSGYIMRLEKGGNISTITALTIFRELKKTGAKETFEEVFWLEEKDAD